MREADVQATAPEPEVRVCIPADPPANLSPNHRHDHWAGRHAAVRQAREFARLAIARHGLPERPWPGRPALAVSVRIAWGRGRRRLDYDNALASCKPWLDEVAAAVGFDDRDVEAMTVRQGRDPEGEGWTEVAVRPAEEVLR